MEITTKTCSTNISKEDNSVVFREVPVQEMEVQVHPTTPILPFRDGAVEDFKFT